MHIQRELVKKLCVKRTLRLLPRFHEHSMELGQEWYHPWISVVFRET